MCGIFNVVNKKKNAISEEVCKNSLSKLHNRGPDLSMGHFVRPHVYMGQTVLSLVGNVKNQTNRYLWSASQRYYINFNGEIYNYDSLAKSFLGEHFELTSEVTDTQVLVSLHDHLKKTEITKKLDGMYAYAIWDEVDECLYYARDIQGEKSLYYYEDNEWLIVSSQIDAILEFTKNLNIKTDLDISVLKDYFYTRHFMQQKKTAYKKIFQIESGALEAFDTKLMKFNNVQTLSVIDYVSESRSKELAELSIEELTNQLDELLSSCVKEMIPKDRKLASVLSGGIDSSLLSSYACKYSDPEVLVAVNHVGKDEISLDLSGFEKCLNRKVSVINVNEDEYASNIASSVSTLGSPLLSHSFIGQNIQSSYVARLGCKAMFGGEGADELFGGYSCYLSPRFESKSSPSLYSGLFPPSEELFEHDQEGLKEELEEGYQKCLDAYSFYDCDEQKVHHAQMLSDFILQVSSVAMRGADLMSMMWSVETRSVFIRKPIVEFALNLPLWAKIDQGVDNELMKTKNILKRVFVKHFNEELVIQKQGFAGFPNESKSLLGDMSAYRSLGLLGITMDRLEFIKADRALEWKLINIEHFLRSKGL